MKKTIALIFGVSITAGVSYVVWSYSGLGKKVLTKWLLKQWKVVAERKQKKIDWKKIEKELGKLTYPDIELLARYTRLDPARNEKKVTKLLKTMGETGALERAELYPLANVVFPGQIKFL